MKKIIAFLLIFCTLTGVYLPCVPQALASEGAEVWDVDGDNTLSILSIGNSFSEDILAYVWEIAHDLGISQLVLGNLVEANGSLADHWANAQHDTAAYTYFINEDGEWFDDGRHTMSSALTSRRWDYVTLQQAGNDSGREETYNEDLANLVSNVKSLSPRSKLVWNMTWAYQEDSDMLASTIYTNQEDMYRQTASAIMNKIVPTGAFAKIVPIGSVAQNIRTSLIRDNICDEDGYHLSKNLGRYLAAMTFVQTITGLDIGQTTWAPEDLPFAWQVLCIESVSNAIEHPFAITPSMHPEVESSPLYTTFNDKVTKSQDNPSGDMYYARLYPYWTKGGYWYSTHASNYNEIITNEDNSKYYWTTRKYRKSTLPAGSVIKISSGYQYRPDGWPTEDKRNTGSRPGNVTTAHTVVNDNYWSTYACRVFNISSTTSNKDITGLTHSDINDIFKIYYPVGKIQGEINDINDFVDLRVSFYKGGYWHCEKSTSRLTNESNSKYFASTDKFTKDTLPVGSVIYVSNAWEFRPERWNGNNLWTALRPHPIDETYTRIGNAQYVNTTYIGFNVNIDGDSTDIRNYTDATIHNNFRIYIPKSAHTHSYNITTNDSTCSATGTNSYSCKTCYHSYTDTIAKKPHTEVTLAAVAPTCTQTGLTEGKKCSVCGTITAAQTTVEMLPHPYSYAVTQDPTFTDIGFLTGTCSVCMATTTIELPILNETDYTKVTTTTSGCTTTGIDTYTWKVTDYGTFPFSVTTAALNHSYTSEVTPPTCTTQGYTTYTCSRCSYSYKDNYVAALAHDYQNYQVIQAPTLEASGTLVGTCTRCSATDVVTLPALNTSSYTKAVIEAPTCTATGVDTYTWNTTAYGNFSFNVTTDPLLHNDNNGDGSCDDCDFGTSAKPQDTVIDFAMSTNINILKQVAFDDVPADVLSGAELILVTNVNEDDTKFGSAVILDTDDNGKGDSLQYIPSAMLCKLIRLNVTVKITTKDGHEYLRIVPVNIVPAPITYYESEEHKDGAIKTAIKNDGSSDPTLSYEWSTVYIDDKPKQQENVNQTTSGQFDPYGYNATYADDTVYSADSSLFVNGLGVPRMTQGEDGNILIDYANSAKYTEAKFTFTGTGFEIISRTGPDQGGLRVIIYKEDGSETGKYIKTITVINKGENNLHQIPVVKADLEEDYGYGTYTVHIFVNAPYKNSRPELSRGGQFYFDAVRIYNPIDTTATDEDSLYIYSIYQNQAEANPKFVEVRNMLLDEKSFVPGNDTIDGVVYLDCTDKIGIADYKSVGPNNEVYLNTDNAVAFKLVVEGEIPTSVDIGAKSANGVPVLLNTGTSTNAQTLSLNGNSTTITTCTAMYYPLNITEWETDEDGSHYIYIAISNTGSGILSITNVKFGYSSTQSAQSLGFRVDRRMLTSFGLVKEENPTLDETLILNMAITVGVEMSVGYSFMADPVTKYESFYLEVTKAVACGEPIVTVYNVEDFDVTKNPATGEAVMYKVTYKGINAKEMGDEFTAALFAVDSNGKIHCGPAKASSIKTALLEKMSAANASTELKTMAIDMLNYGAAAQVRLNYNVENLVNADLTEAQKAYGTQEVPAAEDKAGTDGDGIAINAAITVGSKVELGVSIPLTASSPTNLKCVITDEEGNPLAIVNPEGKYDVMFSAKYGEVGAREMRKVIKVAFFDGETQISQTMTWSVESYVAQTRAKANITEAEVNMVNAMLAYGDAVAAYLNATNQ